MKIILLRHGQSQWNLENRFTGWEDVTLTDEGKKEALFAAKKIIENQILIDSLHCSILERAIETAKIVCEQINFSKNNIKYNWRLNERHYGSLQGLNKSETAKKYGEDQVKIWRRSFDIPPPLLEIDNKRHPRFNEKFKIIDDDLPRGESLKDVIKRLLPFWIKYKDEIKKNVGSHLIVAHSNSLRAIIKILEDLSDDQIISVNIPTGVPLVYDCDKNFNIINKQYLIGEKELVEKQEIIINQGKANEI